MGCLIDSVRMWSVFEKYHWIYKPVAFATYPMPGSCPILGWGGSVGGGALAADDVGSSVAASVKFCENGIGAGGLDIKLAGELA